MSFDNSSASNPGNNDQSGQQSGHQEPTNNQNSTPTGENVFLTVGERAFHTRDDVVKNISHAQDHISNLESENSTLKTESSELKAENERLQAIVDANTQGARQSTSGNDQNTTGLSNEELVKQAADLALGTIENRQTAAQQNANLSRCEAKAKELYGDDYVTTVTAKGKELGMTGNQIDALGKDSPEAFAHLFLTEGRKQSHQPSSSSVNTAAFNQQSNEDERPKNITKMREKDRIAYTSGLMKQAGV